MPGLSGLAGLSGLSGLISSDIPLTIDGLQLWVRADAGTFQDSAKTTTAVSDGDVVGAWADQSGNGRDVLQATTADKPTLRLNVKNGRPAIRFDGISDYLRALYADIAQPFVRFIVIESDGGVTEHILNAVDAQGGVMYIPGTGTFNIRSTTAIVGPAIDTNWHIFVGVFNGASSSLRLDGAITAGDAGLLPIDGGITVSATDGLANFFGGDIAEILDYSNLSVGQIERIEQYLSDRYDITLV